IAAGGDLPGTQLGIGSMVIDDEHSQGLFHSMYLGIRSGPMVVLIDSPRNDQCLIIGASLSVLRNVSPGLQRIRKPACPALLGPKRLGARDPGRANRRRQSAEHGESEGPCDAEREQPR